MYEVEVNHAEELRFDAKTKGGIFTIDAGQGPGPLEVLLASLGSCVGVYIRKYAEGTKLDIGGFSVRVSADLDKGKPFSFKKIDVRVTLKNDALDEHRKRALLEFVKNCPVHATLHGNPTVDMRFI